MGSVEPYGGGIGGVELREGPQSLRKAAQVMLWGRWCGWCRAKGGSVGHCGRTL